MFWADNEGVSLQEDIAHSFDTCKELGKVKSNLYVQVDNQLKGVSSNNVRQNLHMRLDKWLKDLYPTPQGWDPVELEPKKTSGSAKVTIEGTAGTEHITYNMFWAEQDVLELIAASLSDSASEHYPMVPSSTILLEIIEENSSLWTSGKQLSVTLKINDQEAPTKLCNGRSKCVLTDFISALK